MDEIPISARLVALFVLLLVSGCFSAAETNRYRLKNMARSGQGGARLAEWLLARTDRLLGVVLLGNNLINAASASLLTEVEPVSGESPIPGHGLRRVRRVARPGHRRGCPGRDRR